MAKKNKVYTEQELKEIDRQQKAKIKAAKKAKREQKANKLKEGVKGTFSEVKKVSWADGKTVWKKTGVVLSVVLLFGALVFLMDLGLKELYELLVGNI